MQSYKKFLKILKDVTLIDDEGFKTENETKNYKYIKETKLFMQREMNH